MDDPTNLAYPPQCCSTLPFVCTIPRISDDHGEACEESESTAERAQGGVRRRQEHIESHEKVGSRNGLVQFLEEGFKKLLRRLLAMETKLIMKRLTLPAELCRETKVGFRLSQPLDGQLFHRGPCRGS